MGPFQFNCGLLDKVPQDTLVLIFPNTLSSHLSLLLILYFVFFVPFPQYRYCQERLRPVEVNKEYTHSNMLLFNTVPRQFEFQFSFLSSRAFSREFSSIDCLYKNEQHFENQANSSSLSYVGVIFYIPMNIFICRDVRIHYLICSTRKLNITYWT